MGSGRTRWCRGTMTNSGQVVAVAPLARAVPVPVHVAISPRAEHPGWTTVSRLRLWHDDLPVPGDIRTASSDVAPIHLALGARACWGSEDVGSMMPLSVASPV